MYANFKIIIWEGKQEDRMWQNNLNLLQIWGGGGIKCWPLSDAGINGVYQTKGKRTIHEHCTLGDQVVSHTEGQINNSETTTHVYWNWRIK